MSDRMVIVKCIRRYVVAALALALVVTIIISLGQARIVSLARYEAQSLQEELREQRRTYLLTDKLLDENERLRREIAVLRTRLSSIEE